MTKNEIKYLQGFSDKKNRDQEGKFIVEGPKLIQELLKSDFSIEKIYALNDEISLPSSISLEIISLHEMSRISQLRTASSILALVNKPVDFSTKQENTWIIALDGIQDPGNLGTIIRIADWFGIERILVSNDTADCYNSKVVQATMGGIFRVKVTPVDLVAYLSESKLPIYGALLKGENVFAMNEKQKGILVIGNESIGIRPQIQSLIQKPITIPRIGQAESLNAAVATGILVGQLTQS